MELSMTGAAVVFFSAMAFWRQNPALFLVCAGCSIMCGLEWYNHYTTNYGLGISIMIILYAFICIFFAYRMIFFKGKDTGDE